MNIHTNEHNLTDGSKVYGVAIGTFMKGSLQIDCVSEKDARQLAAKIAAILLEHTNQSVTTSVPTPCTEKAFRKFQECVGGAQ